MNNGGAPYLAAAITAAATIILWIASRIVEILIEKQKSKLEKERFIRSLYAEIDFNTSDMREFVCEPISISNLIERLKSSKTLIPHVTDARHTEIYTSNIERINHSGEDYLSDVVYFYGLLERIKGQIDGIQLTSYSTISAEGRGNVVSRIYDHSLECWSEGSRLLNNIATSHPNLKLKPKIRTAPNLQSSADLNERYNRLCLDLDRIRASHNQSS